ncbi:hypothetical protein HanRHA438_Chr10g0437671 [Helianthus annuus]|nr:hypothetical protein HanRHA438_Chr10g0437671 [Helianthus annuus]
MESCVLDLHINGVGGFNKFISEFYILIYLKINFGNFEYTKVILTHVSTFFMVILTLAFNF